MRSRALISIIVALVVYAAAAGTLALHAAQDATTPPTSLANALPPDADGEYIFKNNCATCHGADGKGSPQSVIGFDAPLPDFTDCPTNTVEPFGDWNSVVHRGGPIRGLDHHMPAFGDALSDEQIESVVKYLWSLCDNPSWPRGDLTEKAFPESETVWTTGVTTSGAKSVGNTLVYERRIKQRSQYEISIPLNFQQTEQGGAWNRGIGDVEFALRRSFYANLDKTLIVAAGGAVTLPTGKENLGLGEGVTIWEPFAMFGKGIGANGFLQMHGGAEFPTDTAKKPREMYLRGVYGYTYAVDHGFGRAWTPMAEVVMARDAGGDVETDIVPQMQVSLSKLQHILLSVGVSIPATERTGRHPQFLTYFLWDWFDGGLFQYWH